MATKLEDVVNSIKHVVSPPVVSKRSSRKIKDMFQEEQVDVDSLTETTRMELKYKKLIALLEKTGQTDRIPHLKTQLAKLHRLLHILREKEQDQLHERDLKVQEEVSQYIQALNEQLKTSRKSLEEFFTHYGKDFEVLQKQLEARLVELQKQLNEVLGRLREINKQILDVRTQISELDKRLKPLEQRINNAEATLEKDLVEELLEHNVLGLKINFKKIIHDCVHDKNNPPRNRDDLKSRIMFQVHENIELYKKQQLMLLNKGLSRIDAEQDRIREELERLERLEDDIRLRMDNNPNVDICLEIEIVHAIKEKKQKLQEREQLLGQKEEAGLKIAQELKKEISELRAEKQELAQEISEPSPETTSRPTPLPTTPRIR